MQDSDLLLLLRSQLRAGVLARAVVITLVLGLFQARAQSSPTELAVAVVERWRAGSEKEFAAIYPYREGRDALSLSLGVQASRTPGLAEVIRKEPNRAVLLLSSVPLLPNSGDATVMGRGFSGVYQARLEGGHWKLTSRIPLDDMGGITSHRISVSIVPAHGLQIVDQMRIEVTGSNGFAVRLNHTAKLRYVRAAGRNASHRFGGGLLWVDLPLGSTELTIGYSIDVEERSEQTNSGSFLENSGHVRNQYFWHPFFDFNAAHDWADFEIEARIPREYRVSTSLPQTERIEGAERIVSGKTTRRTMALSLIYDRDWKVESHRFDNLRFDFFVTPRFPDPGEVLYECYLVYELLSKRFGALPGGSIAIVEARSYKENAGWRFASNHAIVAAGQPPVISAAVPVPMAPLAHEIAHLWTQGANGPGMNFLMEGWAVYAESLVIGAKFGQEATKRFWKLQADMYLLAHDGKASLLEDENNSGVAYHKGAWLFRMLEDAMGSANFQKATTDFSRTSQASRSGWEVLAECAQRYAPPDFDARSFLAPWLAGKTAPRLTARVHERGITIIQEPPGFSLPVAIVAFTPQGQERQRIWIRDRETTVVFSGSPWNVQIDPDESLLLRR